MSKVATVSYRVATRRQPFERDVIGPDTRQIVWERDDLKMAKPHPNMNFEWQT